MFADVDWIAPTIPNGYDQWATLIAVFIAGFMLLYRGKVMHDHATRIDAFGWSVILFDAVFGASLMIASVWRLYPPTHTTWADRAIVVAIVVAAIWQLVMVHRASHDRIDRALSPDPPRNEDGDMIPRDRRRYHRRKEDRMLRARIAELEQQK